MTYKEKTDALEARWNELRAYLQKAVDLADELGEDRINVDKTTVLQVIFKMDSMSSEDDA